MKLSVIIPAHNEEGCLARTVNALYGKLCEEKVDHEILIVNDNSSDQTSAVAENIRKAIPTLRVVHNKPPSGYGFAVRCGLDEYRGDMAVIYMADASDTPEDVVRFYRAMVEKKVDCIFGPAFRGEAGLWIIRRINIFLTVWPIGLFKYCFKFLNSDITNAFKMYSRHAIDGLKPFLSHHFNLTVELPLKAIIRGYSYVVLPNTWINRKHGVSKLKIAKWGLDISLSSSTASSKSGCPGEITIAPAMPGPRQGLFLRFPMKRLKEYWPLFVLAAAAMAWSWGEPLLSSFFSSMPTAQMAQIFLLEGWNPFLTHLRFLGEPGIAILEFPILSKSDGGFNLCHGAAFGRLPAEY